MRETYVTYKIGILVNVHESKISRAFISISWNGSLGINSDFKSAIACEKKFFKTICSN